MATDHRAEWLKGVEEGYVSRNWKIAWSTEIDGGECETCRDSADSQVGLNVSFRFGDPPIHEGCRCGLILVAERIDSELAAMSDDALDAEIDRLLAERRSWLLRLKRILGKRKGD